jgi:dolichol-phosphate mannosyltransferase
VGANLVRRLLLDGHEVSLLVRPRYADWRICEIRGQIDLHICELEDAAWVEDVVSRARPEWVFHLAANGAYSWQKDVHSIIGTNVIGTSNLVDSSLRHGVESFIHSGSSSEYGFKAHACAEDEWIEPNSEYAITKAAATHLVRLAAMRHRRRFLTLRLYNIYGPYEEPNRLVPTVIVRGLKGQYPPLVDPNVARDLVYVDEVSDALMRAASAPEIDPTGVFNVGSGIQSTIGDVVTQVRRILQIPSEPIWGTMEKRSWDTAVWVANPARIGRELGWRASIGLAEGLERTVRWFQDHARWRTFYEEQLGKAAA